MSFHFEILKNIIIFKHFIFCAQMKQGSQKENYISHRYSNHNFKYMSIEILYGGQGMLLYNINIIVDLCESITISRSKFIITNFNT
jgi:hypothetical protein